MYLSGVVFDLVVACSLLVVVAHVVVVVVVDKPGSVKKDGADG